MCLWGVHHITNACKDLSLNFITLNLQKVALSKPYMELAIKLPLHTFLAANSSCAKV